MPRFPESGVIRGSRLRAGFSSPYSPKRRTGRGTIIDSLAPLNPPAPAYYKPKPSNDLPQAIFKQRQEAKQKTERDIQDVKAAIDDAYQAGLMTDEEYNNLQTEARQGIESQFKDLMRRTTERLYGQVNIGALKGGLRDIEIGRIGELARARRDISGRRASRRMRASELRAGALSTLFGRHNRLIPEIPSGFTQEQTLTALTGRSGAGGFNPMLSPAQRYPRTNRGFPTVPGPGHIKF